VAAVTAVVMAAVEAVADITRAAARAMKAQAAARVK
jgi:hypothetical protein